MVYPIVINVLFSQSTDSGDKDSTAAQVALVLSKPSSTTFTVEVCNSDEGE